MNKILTLGFIGLLSLCFSYGGYAGATGGTVTNYTLNGTNYTAHIFTNNGTFIVSGGLLNCEILVVAGGGGGGGGANQNFGGGGGGGGLVYNASIYFGIGEYLVNVGVGGTGDIGIGGDGGNSTITN